MKIIHNIINYQRGGGFLEFKLQLSKEDWILINCFQHKPLRASCSINELDTIKNLSDGIEKSNQGFGNPYLKITFETNFTEVITEENETYWVSPLYRIELNHVSPSFQEMLKEIADDLKKQVNEMNSSVRRSDNSCWGEKLEI